MGNPIPYGRKLTVKSDIWGSADQHQADFLVSRHSSLTSHYFGKCGLTLSASNLYP